MPVTFTHTTTKPEGGQFYGQISEEAKAEAAVIWQWHTTFPGFISQDLDKSDPNTRVFTIVFDTVENYANWHGQRLSHPLAAKRSQWVKDNGLTYVSTETIT